MSGDVRAYLDGLDAAHAAATPGPWEATSPRADGGAYIDADRRLPLRVPWIGRATVAADAVCIAAEHNAAPRLVAAVRAVLDLADTWDRIARDIVVTSERDAMTGAADALRGVVTAPLTAEVTA